MNFLNSNDLFLLEEIVKKNFSSKYKDSVLGIFWSVLRPLATMIIFTIIFSTVFRGSIENYPVYFLSGRAIFDFFNISVNLSMDAIKGNKNILMKTSAPKYIFILGAVASEILNFIITLLLLFGVMFVTNAPFYLNLIPLIIIPIISVILMILGLGFMLSICCVYYSDIKHIWGIITLLLMYASALFYPMDIIPPEYRQYMLLNPIFWIIDQFRHFIMWGSIPSIINIINSLLLSLIILILGLIIFKKYEKGVMIKL